MPRRSVGGTVLMPTVLVALLLPCGHASSDYRQQARETFDALQSHFFDHNAGEWRSSMWWQAANTVEAISNLGLLEPSSRAQIEATIALVYNATANATIARCDKGVNLTFSGYFDDELWWGHAWLRAFELTHQEHYLNRSVAIFDDLVERSWSNESCGGGCCWQASRNSDDMAGCYKNAITNELFVSLGARLSSLFEARCTSLSSHHGHKREIGGSGMRDKLADAEEQRLVCAAARHHHAWATHGLVWFLSSGMLNASDLINDGLDTFHAHPQVCRDNGRTAYTYNQGVILSALGELYASAQPAPLVTGVRGAFGVHNTDASVDAATAAIAAVRASAGEAVTDGDSEGDDVASQQPSAGVLRLACAIVEAVWSSHLVYAESGGVLRELSEPALRNGTLLSLYAGNPGTDGLQFKSVLIRHLRYLSEAVLRAHGGSVKNASKAVHAAGGNFSAWRERIAVNARSIWSSAACAPLTPLAPGTVIKVPPLFGYLWRGPCTWAFGGASSTTQTAALDVFTAAAEAAAWG